VRKLLLLSFMSLVLCGVANADGFKTEDLLQPFAESVMAKVGKGELNAALTTMQPFMTVPKKEFETVIENTRTQRAKLTDRLGKSNGYECFGQKKVGQSLLKVTCIEKTENVALAWLFYFYKTPRGWVLISFVWNDNLPALFAER